jgi:hypothetical protein
MSEALAPEAVVEVLNTYFTEMVDLVFKHQGTLDKYVGDALMAVFGVPVPLAHAATRAVECAVAMQRRLEQMKAQGRTPIKGVRIGINTGEASRNIAISAWTHGSAMVNVAAYQVAKELRPTPGERGHFPGGGGSQHPRAWRRPAGADGIYRLQLWDPPSDEISVGAGFQCRMPGKQGHF